MFGIDDPSALLRPWKNLQQFSEELYAMFSRGGPPAEAPPASGRPAARADESRVRRAPDPDPDHAGLSLYRRERLAAARARVSAPEPARPSAHDAPPRPPAPADAETGRPPIAQTDNRPPAPVPPPAYPARQSRATEPGRLAPGREGSAASEGPPAGAARRGPQDDTRRPYAGPPGEDFRRPRHDKLEFKELDIGDFARGVSGGGGTTVFMGKVSSGSGDTYEVTLYQQGPDGPPDKTTVEVHVPMIAKGEKIDAGTWLAAIFQFTDDQGDLSFACQPPVWMP